MLDIVLCKPLKVMHYAFAYEINKYESCFTISHAFMGNNNYGLLHMIIFKYKQLTVWGLVRSVIVK